MAHQATGTLTTDTTGTATTVSGYVTVSAHYDSGTGTLTWQFKGPDGVWRTIYAGDLGTVSQVYTEDHMQTFFFGGDVEVRPSLASSSTPQIDYQIISSSINRP